MSDRLQELISAYLDGSLSEQDEQTLRQRLKADAAARVEPRLRDAWARAEQLQLSWETLQARWFVALCLVARGEAGAARPLFEEVERGARQIHLAFVERRARDALDAL